jgi:D-galactarolactone cycloisomerase
MASLIRTVEAFPVSFDVTPENAVILGVGRMVKRDAVVVKLTTEDGLVGWGEAHHARAPGAMAALINSTIRQIVVGFDAIDSIGLWKRMWAKHYATHGMGAGTAIAMSAIDMAVWDIRGKAMQRPLHQLLGGGPRKLPAYAGGLSLGFQDPSELVSEAEQLVEQGFKAVKLRFGDTPKRDIERLTAVRRALGDDVEIMVDVNAAYGFDQARDLLPALDDCRTAWLEEPFPPHDYRSYQDIAKLTRTPLAAGENHYTRFDFARLIEDRAISVLQPDLSKVGGITEFMRVAALADAWRMPVHPHISMTGINMAAAVHVLCAIGNPGWFEADASRGNLFRDELGSRPYVLSPEGTVEPLHGHGIGVEVDEGFIRAHPLVDGPCYI